MIGPFDFLPDPPPLTHVSCIVAMKKQHNWVGLAVERRDNKEREIVFSMNGPDARRLAERILELLEKKDGSSSIAEGAFLGGPPRADQLMGPPK